jgi:hypothetical protein
VDGREGSVIKEEFVARKIGHNVNKTDYVVQGPVRDRGRAGGRGDADLDRGADRVRRWVFRRDQCSKIELGSRCSLSCHHS